MATWMRLGAVFLGALLVQLTVFVDVRIFGVAPELLSLLAVTAGFFVGPERGPVIAFAAGLMWDIYLPTPLGVSAFTFAVVAFAVGSLNEGLFHETRSQLVAVCGLASGAAVISYALLGSIVGESGLIGTDMVVVALLVGAINAVLAPLVAPLMVWALSAEPQR